MQSAVAVHRLDLTLDPQGQGALRPTFLDVACRGPRGPDETAARGLARDRGAAFSTWNR